MLIILQHSYETTKKNLDMMPSKPNPGSDFM